MFSDAASEAGMSGRYGGIHFRAADDAGRALGQKAADEVWTKAKSCFDGAAASPSEATPEMLPR
jgi:hypothetical protein